LSKRRFAYTPLTKQDRVSAGLHYGASNLVHLRLAAREEIEVPNRRTGQKDVEDLRS